MRNNVYDIEDDAALRQPLKMAFGEFLGALIAALEHEGVPPCILRNYEGFPDVNLGNDIDFLIRPYDLPRAMRALRSIEGIRIVGFAEHPHVASVFLAGTSATSESRSIQVDFFGLLGWKGLPYIPVGEVLKAAVTRRAGQLRFLVPRPAHEAIISLLTSLVVSAHLKDKYLPAVQQIFASDRTGVVAALTPQFGRELSTRLVDSVIEGDRKEITDCTGPLRYALARRAFLHKPFRTLSAVTRHYTMEFSVLYLPRSLETICVLGSSASDKTKLIDSLLPLLQSSAKFVEKLPGCELAQDKYRRGASDRSAGLLPGDALRSMLRVIKWATGEWISTFQRTKNLLLRLDEGCYQEMIVDPDRYAYEGPRWFAKLLGRFLPDRDLWILLDESGEIWKAEDRRVSQAAASMEIGAYRSLASARNRLTILNANEPPDRLTESAYAAIVDTLVERTGRTLASRFRVGVTKS
jgi:hypothetical protein